MRKFLVTALMAVLCIGLAPAGAHAQEEEGAPTAFPVESYICSYVEGSGPAELDAWIDDWNAWWDEQGLTEYTVFTMVPFYYGPDQDFDVIWMGVSPNATSLGRDQETWLSTGGELQASLAGIVTCREHSNFAAVEFKSPGKGPIPDSVVGAFSDCTMTEGTTFDDVAPAIAEWAAYRTESGVQGGIWVFFPAYGGGGEKFDFKYVTSAENLEALGVGWDQYAAGGYAKATELFSGKLNCDASRVYLMTTRRRATPPVE